MIRGILFFVLMFVVAYSGVEVYQKLTKREKIKLKTQLAISAIVAYATLTVCVLIVFLF